VVASFLPPQLGKFKSAIKLSLANGLGFFEVHAIGSSGDPGDRKKLIGGTNLLPDDFEKQRKFVNPEEEATARYEQAREVELLQVQAQNALRTALKTKISGTTYLALPQTISPTNNGMSSAPAAIETTPDPALSGTPATDAAGTVGEGGLVGQDNMSNASSHERDYMYGLTDKSVSKPLDPSHPMLQRREHNRQYNDFLQQSHALRQEAHKKQKLQKSLKKGAIDFSDPYGVNMGMDRGLEEPELKIPVAGEGLWLANGGSAGGEGQGPLRIPADENRLIVKKYNSTPATQAELRDCSAELSQDNLKLVVGSHKVCL
jgi:hypothetical protein